MTRHLGDGTVLKAMLRARHMQTHSVFTREYEKVAAEHEPDMVGRAPKKAQFYRWLSGDLKDLPYPGHCRVLEAMFPAVKVEELFATGPRRTARRQPSANRINTLTKPPSKPRPAEDGGPEAKAARMRALMSWVDANSPLKEADIHPEHYRTYSRGRGVERGR
ncbi:hypothetical protein OG225_30675 [Nocardia sp. NBC_01377]|uniref:hypothetical protein n=1 Tax=Nocardia sp. NBC_01377 TaxID=2903595 RepID=UPI003255C976